MSVHLLVVSADITGTTFCSDRSFERYALPPVRTILQRLGLPTTHPTTEESTA